MIKDKYYKVKGLLKRGNTIKHFSVIVKARNTHKANRIVKNGIEGYCRIKHPFLDPVQCIINKKTVKVHELPVK